MYFSSLGVVFFHNLFFVSFSSRFRVVFEIFFTRGRREEDVRMAKRTASVAINCSDFGVRACIFAKKAVILQRENVNNMNSK